MTSPSNHEVLLFEQDDPAEIKVVANTLHEGVRSLIYEAGDKPYTIKADPLGVLLPIDDYLELLEVFDQDRHDEVVKEIEAHRRYVNANLAEREAEIIDDQTDTEPVVEEDLPVEDGERFVTTADGTSLNVPEEVEELFNSIGIEVTKIDLTDEAQAASFIALLETLVEEGEKLLDQDEVVNDYHGPVVVVNEIELRNDALNAALDLGRINSIGVDEDGILVSASDLVEQAEIIYAFLSSPLEAD